MRFTKMLIDIFKIAFRLGASGTYADGLTNEKLEEIAVEHISSFIYGQEVLGESVAPHIMFLVDDHFDDELDA